MKKYILLFILAPLAFGTGFRNACAQNARPDSAGIQRLPSIPFLPDPLVLDEGGRNIPVTGTMQWNKKRQWIKKEYQHWISGSVPPPPKSFHASILKDTVENGVRLRTVELRFGPEDRAKMTVELMIPPSAKPLPVFMTQWNHRGWAKIAVRRGYIGCVYAGADAKDDTRNYDQVFPGYDFATLMKRAWGASRVVDYLYTLPEADTLRIALTGHSRNGKQSLMAAAFDNRITAVVSSSGGTGGESTFRFSDERFDSESLQEITHNFPHWFCPRLHWFSGREDKLPVDQNSLMSLIAPRGLMLVSAVTEGQGNPWGVEQSYRSVKEVYHFLHSDSTVAILLRQGRHQHAARDVENYIDFFDYVFGRSAIPPANQLYTGYSFERWKQLSGENIDPARYRSAGRQPGILFPEATSLPARQDSIRKKIGWLMGFEPPGVNGGRVFSPKLTGNRTYPDDYLEEVIEGTALPAGIRKMTFGPYTPLGEDLWGTIYFPESAVTNNVVSRKLPLVIFLHEYAYATGYHRRSATFIRDLTSRGFAVLAFDLPGFGTRIEEARHFYDRYPRWSLMGKMVADTRNIISDVYTRMPFIDTANLFLAGYSLGGTVALLTAALDTRVKGTAVAAAFGSLRNDNTGTEGIRHFSHLHGLLPRLGFFVGQEDRIPLDFQDILACIAPRPLLVIAPERDRDHPAGSVRRIMTAVSALYDKEGAAGHLRLEVPADYNHFPDAFQQSMAAWMQQRR
ncbi:alpha/beta fold hydrolase [Compostibacter hankyongensis]|uniref:Alpha/beta fold hydrolase n=1 Tax=Compostibacter hankyongensis TaxID=1007089 RepID=A0ABP8G1T5_9BACT